MQEILEKLWNEYFAEECAVMDTEEERVLIRRATEKQKTANELLTKEQSDVFEKYIEAVYEMQGFYSKKAFFKGCEFAISFFFEAVNGGQQKGSLPEGGIFSSSANARLLTIERW